MRSAIGLAYFAAYALLFLTIVTSAYAVWRRHDLHRLNILIVLAALFAGAFTDRRGIWFLIARVLLVVAQPYFLLRLVWHFREVPRWLMATVLLAMPVATVAVLIRHSLIAVFPPLWAAVIEFYVASVLTAEARRTAGVTRWRLFFAASGTWVLATAYVLSWLSPYAPAIGNFLGASSPAFLASIAFAYLLAFNTPRGLRARWQRTEQARYLSATSDRGPEERGLQAAEDLNRAAARSVAHSLILVAEREDLGSRTLTVRASSDPARLGLTLTPGLGLVGRVLDAGREEAAKMSACEPAIRAHLEIGAEVLVAPIASATSIWGVVIVVQRRGSLFPEDDLRLLAQFARYAATALDHAYLVTEARDRARRAADRRLREIETRMSLMLDSIKDYAMFVLDQHGRIATWQVGAQHVFGYTDAEILDAPAAKLFDAPPEDFDALLDRARGVGRAEREGTCVRRDGIKFTAVTTVRPLEAEVGDPPGFVLVTRDVTERRTLQARLEQSEKMEAIGQLAGGIAHDFNNLLTAILGYADWLDRELAGQGHEEISQIQRAAERAAALTGQLLAFSRHQMNRPTAIDISQLAKNLVPMLRRVIGEHILIVEACDDDVPAVMGDHSQVEQIILNLAVNARDAMPGGGRLTIRTALAPVDARIAAGDLTPGPHVLLEVSDTGIGMDAPTMVRIFEPFFTTKELSGTGLGLATVYGIVKQMQGAIRVESAPARGAVFRLYFPATHERAAGTGEPPVAEIAGGHEAILIVEDDDVVRTFLERTLDRHGYRVSVAARPQAALTMVERGNERFDLVITDIVLPGMTGLEFVRQLDRIQPNLPALYISGYAEAVLAREGTRPKAGHFLQKPFSAADLLNRIRQILETG